MKLIFTIILVLAAFIGGRKINSDQSGVRILIDRHTTEKGLTEIIQKAKMVNMNLTIDETELMCIFVGLSLYTFNISSIKNLA